MHQRLSISHRCFGEDVGWRELRIGGAGLQARGWQSMREGLGQLSLEGVLIALESKRSRLRLLCGKQRVGRNGLRVRGRRWRSEMNSSRWLLFCCLPCCLGWYTWTRGPSMDHGVVWPPVGKCHPLEVIVGADVFHLLPPLAGRG